METEKITINMGAIDLGQIDLLVEQGFYSNRTDFIRTAIRNQINVHSNDLNSIKSANTFGLDVINEGFEKVNNEFNKLNKELSQLTAADILGSGFAGTGVYILTQNNLKKIEAQGKKIDIKMVGMLSFTKDVTPELVRNTIRSAKVYGILRASEEVKKVLAELK